MLATDPMSAHAIDHWPSGGVGYGVCECGATIRVVNGQPTGDWHECDLCTHANYHTDVPHCVPDGAE